MKKSIPMSMNMGASVMPNHLEHEQEGITLAMLFEYASHYHEHNEEGLNKDIDTLNINMGASP